MTHEFHVPVMGTAFTIDCPLRVARFGISSVISIGDDELCEEMRAHYAGVHQKPYEPIKKWTEDYRARRVTAYLDLVQDILDEQMATLRQEPFTPESDITKYFDMLPDSSPLKAPYLAMREMTDGPEKEAAQADLRTHITPGDIEVNIMTKIDRLNYTKDGELLPEKYADALAGLRGFAQSRVHSGIVFSAGFNRRLYAYISEFDDFFPDENGYLKKRIILKVSDYRSSMTQAKFLAKKGIWISEHRIESGLNCGGHAFATDGYLLGPILEEFKTNRHSLAESMTTLCNDTLEKLGRTTFATTPELKITVQGGIGTANEQRFLMDHFQVDRTGWATPFLLVPEVTVLDDNTRKLLAEAPKESFYLSEISPLGVPFNSVRDTESEKQRLERIEAGNPGSPCPKAFLVSNTEFTKVPICTASRTFQRFKLKQLNEADIPEEERKMAIELTLKKTCLCEDLAASALINNDINNKRSLRTAVCSGPNMAYFSTISTLADMVGHIYGRLNLLNDLPRPNMFIAELKMYIDYLTKEVKKTLPNPADKKIAYFNDFIQTLEEGMDYYKDMIPKFIQETSKYQDNMKAELAALREELHEFIASHAFLKSTVSGLA